MVRRVTKTIRSVLLMIAFVVITVSVLVTDVSAYSIQEGINAARGTDQPSDLFGSAGVITNLTNILLFVVGALSVIMIIIGGLRYVVSGGNSTSVTTAKNTILYAIVGLVVSFLAFAAINFVLGNLTPGAGAGYTDV